MFIIFGTKAIELASEPLENVACGYCGNETLVATTVQRYFHVFWVPTIPIGRITGTECMHCRQVLVGNEIPTSLEPALEPIRAMKTPVWAYAGLMVLGVFVGLGSLAGGSGGSGRTPRYYGAGSSAYGGSAREYSGSESYASGRSGSRSYSGSASSPGTGSPSRSGSLPRPNVYSATESASIIPTWDLLEAPARDDLYIVDLSEAFGLEEETFRFGILKVTEISDDSLTFIVGTKGYPDTYDATLAIDAHATTEAGFFLPGEMILSHDDLLALYRRGPLAKVVRLH